MEGTSFNTYISLKITPSLSLSMVVQSMKNCGSRFIKTHNHGSIKFMQRLNKEEIAVLEPPQATLNLWPLMNRGRKNQGRIG